MQVLGLSDRDAVRAGVERCCRVSGDSCFLLEQDKDRFALAHFTGEYEYVFDEKWMATDQVQVVNPSLQASLLTSSCQVVVDMAQVSLRDVAEAGCHWDVPVGRICPIVLTCYLIRRNWLLVPLRREPSKQWTRCVNC